MSAQPNIRGTTTTFITMSDDKLKLFHQGWVDRQNGVWRSEYEAMSADEQGMYEVGRAAVLNVMMCGPVPVWRGDRRTAIGTIDGALKRSIKKVGNPFVYATTT